MKMEVPQMHRSVSAQAMAYDPRGALNCERLPDPNTQVVCTNTRSRAQMMQTFFSFVPSISRFFFSAPTVRPRSPAQGLRLETELLNLRLTDEQLQQLLQKFTDEMKSGLEMHRDNPLKFDPSRSCFRSIDSCLATLPTGGERGIVYALDFGGTNCRAVRCALNGNGDMQVRQIIQNLSEAGADAEESFDLMHQSTPGTVLFDFLSQIVKKLMRESGDLQTFADKPVKLGFTFSFPGIQTSLNKCVLQRWTKGFSTGIRTDDPVENRDVGELLQKAFIRNNVPAECVAICNDTVGTLLSCAYQQPSSLPPCLMGVILGTGSNCCYVEPHSGEFKYQGNIINMESGNFNKGLFRTLSDIEIDWHSPNKGEHLYEKMVSGFYIGELVRLFTLRIMQDRAPRKAWERFSLKTEHVAILAADVSRCSGESLEVLKNVWGVAMEPTDVCDIQVLSAALFARSAALAAVSIGAVYKHIQPKDGMTVGIDGSLYVKNPWYSGELAKTLKRLLGAAADRLFLLHADDGSGKGAALCAATFLE